MEEWEGQGYTLLMVQEEHCAVLGVNMGKGTLWTLSDPMPHSAVSMRGCPVGQGHWLATQRNGNKGTDQRNNEDLGFTTTRLAKHSGCWQ